jgi:hypothetical protein
MLHRAVKLICNRVIHGFEFVCLLRLICRDLTCVSRFVYRSVEFKKRHTIPDSWITRLHINLIAVLNFGNLSVTYFCETRKRRNMLQHFVFVLLPKLLGSLPTIYLGCSFIILFTGK